MEANVKIYFFVRTFSQRRQVEANIICVRKSPDNRPDC